MMGIFDKQNATPEWSIRAVFDYDADGVRLVDARRVRMLAPPSDDLEGIEGRVGAWYELRNADGDCLYRRVTDTLVRRSAEVLTDDPDRPLRREDLRNARGSFILILPDLPRATQLVVFGSPAESEPAARIGQFPLDALRGAQG